MCAYSWRVPANIFGQLKIVPSADLGDMGPQQGEAASYNWKWYYSAGKLAIWMALILALVVPKSNRDIRALMILVPLAIVNLLWWLFMKYAKMNSTDALEFGVIFNSVSVSVTVLWLMANSFARFGGAVRFLLAFGTLVIVANIGTLSYDVGFSRDTFLFSVLFVVTTFALLLAMTVSSLMCRRRYKPGRFMLWLALWILIESVLAVCVFYAVLILGAGTRPSWSDLPQMIWILILPGSMFGLFLYVLNLPFMILGFAQPFFRERLCACLDLKPITTPVTGSGGLDGGQSPVDESGRK